MRNLFMPAALSLMACAGGQALPVAHIHVPEGLVFDQVQQGQNHQLALQILNSGTADAAVRLEATAPFSVPSSVTVRSGAAVDVGVGFMASDYQGASGSVTVVQGGWSQVVLVEATVSRDGDGDGAAAQAAGGDDCDDSDDTTYPGAVELCDGADNDCDGDVDEDAADRPSWYLDGDGDTWGAGAAVVECERPAEHVNRDGDCDDVRGSVNPGATEIWYDGVDQDCDGASDYDADRDGHDAQGYGGGDCADSDPNVHPGADDTPYDGVDQDCDGWSDYDADLDGYDATSHGGADCDDTTADVSPGLAELDDGVDQDCDGWVDEDYVLRGDLVLTEVFVSPTATTAANGQFIELSNGSKRTIDLSHYALSTNAGTLSLPTELVGPGAAVMVCANTSATDNGGITCIATLPGPLVASDELGLDHEWALDEVALDGWSLPSGSSLELDADSADPDLNDSPSSWCASTTELGNGDYASPGTLVACP